MRIVTVIVLLAFAVDADTTEWMSSDDAVADAVWRARSARHLPRASLETTTIGKAVKTAGQMQLPECCSCVGCDGCHSADSDCCEYCEGTHTINHTQIPTSRPTLAQPWVAYPAIGFKSGLIFQVLGWGGFLTTMYLFLFPIGAMRTILAQQGTSNTDDTPYIVSMMNCGLWVLYLRQTVGEPQPLATNIAGFILELCKVVLFGLYHSVTARIKLMLKCSLLVVFLFAINMLAELSGNKRWCLGRTCVMINVLMCIYPLSVMRMVIRVGSVKLRPASSGSPPVEILSFALSRGTFVASLFWAAYALWVGDPIIGWPMNLGVAIGLAQLVLYSLYNRGDATGQAG